MAKQGRNKPCECSSGKKHKHCCMKQRKTSAALWKERNDAAIARLALDEDVVGGRRDRTGSYMTLAAALSMGNPLMPYHNYYDKEVHKWDNL